MLRVPEIAQDSRFPMPINREMTDKECLHCGSKIERVLVGYGIALPLALHAMKIVPVVVITNPRCHAFG